MSKLTIAAVAVLARIDIRCWTGERVDKSASDETARNHGADTKSIKAIKRLLGNEHKRLQAIQVACAAARKALRDISHPYAPGYVMIPVADWESFLERVAGLQSAIQTQVDDFLTVYADLRESSRDSLGSLWSADDYPSVDRLRDRFGFDVTLLPIPSTQQFDGMFKLQEVEERMKRGLADHLESVTNAAQESARSRLLVRLCGDDGESGVIAKLANYTGKRDGTFRDATVTGTLELCDTLDRLNVFGDATLSDWIARTRSAMQPGADTLRSDPAIRAQSVAELKRIAIAAGIVLPDVASQTIAQDATQPESVETPTDTDSVDSAPSEETADDIPQPIETGAPETVREQSRNAKAIVGMSEFVDYDAALAALM